jgi:uncharacterized membrane protein
VPIPGLINAWWAFFVLCGMIDRFGTTIKDPTASTIVALLVHLLSIAAAICAILLIRRIGARQDARFRALGGTGQFITREVPQQPDFAISAG